MGQAFLLSTGLKRWSGNAVGKGGVGYELSGARRSANISLTQNAYGSCMMAWSLVVFYGAYIG